MPNSSVALTDLEQARSRAREAGAAGDWPQAARWAERAWRLADRRLLPSLELAAVLARTDDPRAVELLARAATQHAAFPVLLALAAAQHRQRDDRAAQSTLGRLLATVSVDALPPVSDLAGALAARGGVAGWLGWRGGRLLFGSSHATPQAMEWTLDGRRLALEWTREAALVWSAAPPESDGRVRASLPLLGTPLRPARFRALAGVATADKAGVRGWVWFPHDPERPPAVSVTVLHRGHRREVVPDLAVAAPTAAAPFARRRAFDVRLPRGAVVLGVTETGSGQAIPMAPVSDAAAAGPEREPGVDALLRRYGARPCVLLVTHDEGGGIERHVEGRLQALRRAGRLGLPLRSQRDRPGVASLGGVSFQLPVDGPALLGALRAIGPVGIEYHHLHRHDRLVWRLGATLGIPHAVFLHDYALLCPRVTLVGADGRYCGEPPVAQCERCVAAIEPPDRVAPEGVAALRQRSTALLAGAERVRAPSADAAARFRRHLPAAAIGIRPWEVDRLPASPARSRFDGAHVCVVGALNHQKGFGILLDCVRDAAIRRLPIRFSVVGHTSDDAALIEAGAFVTGRYLEPERAELIARQRATIGFLPSIWPEPWCYALTGLLRAGLPTLCFDIGAQAERVRVAGGHVLPLGTPAAAINRRFLELFRSTIGPDPVTGRVNMDIPMSA